MQIKLIRGENLVTLIRSFLAEHLPLLDGSMMQQKGLKRVSLVQRIMKRKLLRLVYT